MSTQIGGNESLCPWNKLLGLREGGKSTRVVTEGKKEEERYKNPTVRDY